MNLTKNKFFDFFVKLVKYFTIFATYNKLKCNL